VTDRRKGYGLVDEVYVIMVDDGFFARSLHLESRELLLLQLRAVVVVGRDCRRSLFVSIVKTVYQAYLHA